MEVRIYRCEEYTTTCPVYIIYVPVDTSKSLVILFGVCESRGSMRFHGDTEVDQSRRSDLSLTGIRLDVNVT